MLKHISPLLTPPLLKIMAEMGHGESLLICDSNYPGSTGGGERVYITNCTITKLLECILYYFPLDVSVDYAAAVMQLSRASGRYDAYKPLIEANGSKLQDVERFEFYSLAEKAVVKIITTDIVKGGNILLKKGVVSVDDIPTIGLV